MGNNQKAAARAVNEEEWDEEARGQARILKAFFGTAKQYFGGFNRVFKGVSDPRNPDLITYPLAGLLFTGVWMFACQLGSRRQIQAKLRGNSRSEAKFEALFGVESIPHGDSLNYGFKRLEVEEMQEAVCRMIEALIRKKVLYPWRLLKYYYLVAIDGTGMLSFGERHCEYCLTRKLNNGTTLYYHPVLEAKLVTTNGFAFSLMTEFIENRDPQASKQDCELKAFYRLAERLKKRFPRLPLCLLLDGLFAGGPTLERCERYAWKYLIVLTDDDLPTVNREFEALCQIAPDNQLQLELGKKKEIEQAYRWMDEIAYVDTQGKEHQVSVLECLETKPGDQGKRQTTKFKWLTNFVPSIRTVSLLANEGGRLRWKIENEGFNAQKNGGFELEHSYSQDETAAKVFYYLLQIAHILVSPATIRHLMHQWPILGVGGLFAPILCHQCNPRLCSSNPIPNSIHSSELSIGEAACQLEIRGYEEHEPWPDDYVRGKQRQNMVQYGRV